MTKQNGIIKLCVLMAFISYFIWSNNEKKILDQSITVNTLSSINQELNINEGSDPKSEPNQSAVFQENFEIPINLILIHDELIKIGTFF